MALRDLLLISLLFLGPACDEEDTAVETDVDTDVDGDADGDADADTDACLNDDRPAIHLIRLQRLAPVPQPAEAYASSWAELEELAPGAGAWII
jgi:hypothetical protein